MPQQFTNLEDFVDQFLKHGWQKKVYDSQHNIWCDQWYKHPEAVLRLRTLWQYYEIVTSAADPIHLANWITYMDNQMEILTSTKGCFRECNPIHKELNSTQLITTLREKTSPEL